MSSVEVSSGKIEYAVLSSEYSMMGGGRVTQPPILLNVVVADLHLIVKELTGSANRAVGAWRLESRRCRATALQGGC
jgi:hypothetical protein